ncbi:MAG: DUF3822 family protein [Bacteroidales bacterium]|nr:DUF3822 family protein [Bacteroidales bacterium]MBN2757890.1 DUF3822 family protein [Bacteroidales bacterium]
MKDFALFHDSFVLTKTSTYHLSIMLNQSGYSYCIVDSVRKKCVAIKNVNFGKLDSKDDYYQQIEDYLKKDAFLAKQYKSIDFIYATEKSTLVPIKLFDKRRLKEHYSFVEQLNEYEELHFNKLNRTNAVNVFSIPSFITTLMVNKFPELRFYHQGSTFVDNTLKKSKEVGNVIGIMVFDTFFDLALCKYENLILYSNFEFKTESDFVYHIINVLQQMTINSKDAQVYLSGNIDKDSKHYKLISKYISNIKFVKISDNSDCQYPFKEIPEHYLTNLLNIE